MRSTLCLLTAIVLVVSSCASDAQSLPVDIVPAFPRLSFDQPTDIQSPRDGTNRLFVCQKGGLIRVFENNPDASTTTTFLNLSRRVQTSSEMGLLGLAFHPDFAENGYFYVNYNIRRNDSLLTVISRFNVDPEGENPNVADTATELVLLEFEQPYANHDGGPVVFGPDGYLYIATGDGGSGGDPLNSGQSLNTMLGKILRIDVDIPADVKNYSIPADNPFAGDESDETLDEIYAYGMRNPWRISFDSETGRLWAGDVGQDRYEEIDIIEKGKNYGWRVMEAWHCYNPRNGCDSTGLTGPVWEYGRDLGSSITGGYVYHGSSAPDLEGLYLYADFVSGRVWALEYDAAAGVAAGSTLLKATGLNVSTFGVDEANELYMAAFNGTIYRFVTTTGVGKDENGEKSGSMLMPVRPTPAKGRAMIPYYVAERTSVFLALYDELGREVARLVDSEQGMGDYEVEFDTSRLSEGTYYCRLTTAAGILSQSVTVVR